MIDLQRPMSALSTTKAPQLGAPSCLSISILRFVSDDQCAGSAFLAAFSAVADGPGPFIGPQNVSDGASSRCHVAGRPFVGVGAATGGGPAAATEAAAQGFA